MVERELFLKALEIVDPIDRAAFLDRECAGNLDLRLSIEALLAADAVAGQFLDEPHPEAGAPLVDRTGEFQAAQGDRASLPLGSVIAGKYKLLQVIGEGGMGAVFMADQTEPVKRRVALKLIRSGMDSKSVLARFEAERQALALMNHPHIAKVLDAGSTLLPSPGFAGEGMGVRVPFFVMELVKGVPIIEYCDSHRLTIGDRLNLFTQVCSAVQHAHQKGIIHRDLKPSNILVESHDGKPVPKVIDFGLAKATSGLQLTEQTMFTALGQIAGTPLYMAPEQAAFNAIDIDTRADIYALGVILYELLTGTTPIQRETLKRAAFDEILRVVREQEPPTPSSRLSSSETKASVAAVRQMEPTTLGRFVKGDLDWIVMKALSKERDRRYETANGFARDIERFLNHEPVVAGPPTATYRMRKFVRRHRAALASVTAIVVLLAAGLGVSLWQMSRAVDAETKAKANEEASAKALEAETKARENEARARKQAFEALRTMTTDVVERKFAQGVVLTEDDKAFLRGVIAQYDAFAALQGEDSEARSVQAEGRLRVGRMRHRLGQLKEAEHDYDAALGLYEQLANDVPNRAEFRQELARSHHNRAFLLNAISRLNEAETEYVAAIGIQKQLADEFPSRPEFCQDLARTYCSRGTLLRATNRLKEAEADIDAAIRIQKQLAEDFPASPEFRQELAKSIVSRGILRRVMGRPKESAADYDAAIGILKHLVDEFPAGPEFRQDLVKAYANRGRLLDITGRQNEALDDYNAGQGVLMQLAADFPTRPNFRQDLAIFHLNRGGVLDALGRLKESAADYDASLRLYRQLVADFPNVPDWRAGLAGTYVNLAILHLGQGNGAEAKRLLIEGRPHHLATLKANPRDHNYRDFYRNHLNTLAQVHAFLLEAEDAVRAAETRRDLGWDPPVDAYDAATILAWRIADVIQHDKLDDKQRKEAERFYADAAMKLLREAVAKGFRDSEKLNTDKAYDRLRDREDFKKLIAELEQKPVKP